MTCREAHDAIRQGERPEAHLAECEPCRSLAAGGALVARALARLEPSPAPPAPPPALDDRRPLAALRAATTRARAAATLLVAVAIPLLVALLAPRRDLPIYPHARMALAVALLAAVGLGLAARALRRLDRPDRVRWADPTLVAGAAAVVALIALLPAPYASASSPFWKCLLLGAAVGAPVVALVLALDRVGSRRTVLQAALAGAVVGNLALQLHCPVTAADHLLLGHALLVPLAAALVMLARR